MVLSAFSAAMSNKEAVCNLRFSLVPSFFTNLTERAQQDPTAKLTTLPSLGLLDKSAWPDNVAEATSTEGKAPWELLSDHVAHLNSENPGSTKYKVLFITRHGQGYHNTFEAKVGREAWDVSFTQFTSSSQVLTACRVTGHTSTETAPSSGPMQRLTKTASNKLQTCPRSGRKLRLTTSSLFPRASTPAPSLAVWKQPAAFSHQPIKNKAPSSDQSSKNSSENV